jgi:hypothetical protein
MTAGAVRPIQLSNNIANSHGFAISPHMREFCHQRPSEIRGRRECRAHAAPAASRAKSKKHTSVVTTVTPETPGIPRAMVLTVSFVLSRVTGLVCHPRRRSCLHRLDSSVGASGPHDFAVRETSALVSSAICVHRIPRPTSVTIAKRPSEGAGPNGNIPVSTWPSSIFSEIPKLVGCRF